VEGVLKEAVFPQLNLQKGFSCRSRETVIPNSHIAFALKYTSFKDIVTNPYIAVEILNEKSFTVGLSFSAIG
jgi:hypothetical protein